MAKRKSIVRGGAAAGTLLTTNAITSVSSSSTLSFFTTFLMIIVLGFMTIVLYYIYIQVSGSSGSSGSSYTTLSSSSSAYTPFSTIAGGGGGGGDDGCHASIFTNPYSAPSNTSHLLPLPNATTSAIVPINVPTRGIVNVPYTQLGILTRNDDTARKSEHGPLILPLMGRPLDSARNKYQYYAISNTGSVNTKLQVRSQKNKICTNEYGCDELYNGDSVYVQGYNDMFQVTMYENATLTYLPNHTSAIGI